MRICFFYALLLRLADNLGSFATSFFGLRVLRTEGVLGFVLCRGGHFGGHLVVLVCYTRVLK